ncbi:ABC transporter ATP-binding protein [Streptomyces xanthochromogenes]|uniref:ABC transporter ATP-binding protein n=1 Tax=Streptomyces xanthochromogenes TaxID=67384 RepID=UPI003414CC59
MRSLLRTWRLLVDIGREVGIGLCALFIGVSAISLVGPLLLALGLRPLADGAAAHDADQVAAGAVPVGVALLVTALAPLGYRWATIRMRERSRMVVQRRVLTLSAEAPGLEHFELPEFQDRLQLLKRNVEDLADGMTLAVIGPLVIAQLVLVAGLLAEVQPVLLALPLIALPATRLAQKAEELYGRAELSTAADRRTAQHVFDLAVASESGAELRVYGLKDELLSRHRTASLNRQRATESALLRSVLLRTGSWLLFAGAYVAAVLLVLRQASRGQATAGDVALTLGLASAVVGAALTLSGLAGSVTRTRVTAEHYEWLRARAGGAVGTARPPAGLTRGVVVENLAFSYPGTERQTLSDVSLQLPAGTVVALVGENGAGKTTLVKLLCGMYQPTAGRILLDETDLADVEPLAYRERITAVFQDFARFELPVRENVGVGNLDRMTDAAAVRASLESAGARFVEQLPQGLDTPLGASWRGGMELSGGQWQKLALARSMMRRRPLVTVFDEPTASLDPSTEHALFEQVAAEARQGKVDGRVTLLISHRFSTVRMADLIVVLKDGRIAECGSHDELIVEKGLYAELYALQAAAYGD